MNERHHLSASPIILGNESAGSGRKRAGRLKPNPTKIPLASDNLAVSMTAQ